MTSPIPCRSCGVARSTDHFIGSDNVCAFCAAGQMPSPEARTAAALERIADRLDQLAKKGFPVDLTGNPNWMFQR